MNIQCIDIKSKTVLFTGLLLILFSSCSNWKDIEKRKYQNGYYSSENSNKVYQKKNIDIYSWNNKTDTIPQNADSSKVLTISSKVGEIIDSSEKAQYHLFPYWENDKFLSAQFIQQQDGSIVLVGKMKDGTIKKMPYTKSHYTSLATNTFEEKNTVQIKKPTKQWEKGKVVKLSPIVGKTINSSENAKYNLFPSLDSTKFYSAKFIQKENGQLILQVKMINGDEKQIEYTAEEFQNLAKDKFDLREAIKAYEYGMRALLLFLIGFILIFPIIIAAYYAYSGYKLGRRVQKRHQANEEYNYKKKAAFGVIIGYLGFSLTILVTLVLLLIGLGII